MSTRWISSTKRCTCGLVSIIASCTSRLMPRSGDTRCGWKPSAWRQICGRHRRGKRNRGSRRWGQHRPQAVHKSGTFAELVCGMNCKGGLPPTQHPPLHPPPPAPPTHLADVCLCEALLDGDLVQGVGQGALHHCADLEGRVGLLHTGRAANTCNACVCGGELVGGGASRAAPAICCPGP